MSAFINFEISDNQVDSPDQFITLVNGLFYNRLSALKDFRKKKQKIIDEEAKRDLLEKCASDIMFDYERLDAQERECFDQAHGERVQEMMIQISMLPNINALNIPEENRYKVNYRVLNLEVLCELRLNLIEFLKDR